MDYQMILESNTKQMMGVTREAVKITPLEMYNVERAKIAANLHWLFAKAYGIDRIPEDMRDPFYTDQYEQEHIKPCVISLLVSSELYCNVLGLILKRDQKSSLQSHQCVIQALALKDIYVMKRNDRPVTHADLACTPIKLSSHMHMVDALMMAYTMEMISMEKVLTCVKRFCTFPFKELPLNVEETIIFWINKVNLTMRKISEKDYKAKQHPLNSASQKVRCTQEHTSDRQLPHFPVDLMRDVCDGAALLTVVHFYCPDLMKLDDICLKENTAADRLNNIQLLKEFANEYLNKSFYLTLEDMLYSPPVLKHNVMVFIAELFWWFEILKPEFVHQRDAQELKDAQAVTQSNSFWLSVPISSAGKQSFQVSTRMAESARSVPNVPKVCNSYFQHTEDPDSFNEGNFKFSPPQQVLRLREKQQNYQQEENTLAFPTGNEDSQRGSSQRGGTRDGPSSSARRLCWANARSCLLRFFRRCFSFFCCCYYSPEQLSKDDCLDAVPSNAVFEEKKTGMSIFFKDDKKTEEEMALHLNQQKRAEDARLLKQQLQAESQFKSAEARNPPKPKPKRKPKKQRPMPVLKDIFTLPKITPSTFSTGNEDSQRGSPQRGGTRDGPSSSARRRPLRALNRTYIIRSSSDRDVTFLHVPPSTRQSHSYNPTVTVNVKSPAEQSPGVYRHTSVAEEVLCAGQRSRKAYLLPVIDSKVKTDSLPQSVRPDRLKHGQKLNEEKGYCLDAVPSDAVYEEKKTGMCFFIKNEQKAEDEMAKKRTAFLLNQQKRAEEARLLKQQLEAEGELKRAEARRKAEQERIMKEDDDARRELIKQEHLKNKYQWQNPPKPKPKPKPKKKRPKPHYM